LEIVISESGTNQLLLECMSGSKSRIDFWVDFINRVHVRKMVEVGVYRGDFAAALL